MWCRPPVPRAARARDAWLCHESSVGGARRRGCAAAGAPESFWGLLKLERALRGEALGALGDRPRGGVVAALHAAQRATLEVDDLTGHDADLRDRGVARRRACDLDRAADRIQRVAD